jgi:hypothetical protein
MVFRQRNHEVQAFPPQCADEPFAERIRLRTPGRGFHHLEFQVAYAAVQRRREDTVVLYRSCYVWNTSKNTIVIHHVTDLHLSPSMTCIILPTWEAIARPSQA